MTKLVAKRQISLGLDPDTLDSISSEGIGKRAVTKPDASVGPTNLGQAVRVQVPDFSDPKRAKTCLEVDFPLVPVNTLSKLEGNAGKPIYQMSKWWARRRSSVFRAMLIAAAMQAPTRRNEDGSPMLDGDGLPLPDETESAKAVWDVYYANHQKAGSFQDLRVLDCFMGGGTTLVEGSRLGFQVAGVDLNPVAWFVVRNELACTDPNKVRAFFEKIEAEVKPVIQPFYVTECPEGHSGRWYQIAGSDSASDDKQMLPGFDPLAVAPVERMHYRYEGPEVIYTFWAKHGHCSRPGCGHRTPIFRSPVIAEKKLGVKYVELTCKACKTAFHAELGAARIAPEAERVVLGSESPFTELSQPFAQRLVDYSKGTPAEMLQRAADLYAMVASEPGLKCPACGDFAGQYLRDVLSKHASATRRSEIDKKHLAIQPPRNGTKHVYCYLLIDPDWLKGTAGVDGTVELGGYPEATVEATAKWYKHRLQNQRLIEVRGRVKLAEDSSNHDSLDAQPIPEPDEEAVGLDLEDAGEVADRTEYGLPRYITLESGRRIDTRRGTVPQKSHFICGKCGLKQDVRESTEKSGHAAPTAAYAIQGYCAECDTARTVYNGRFFSSLTHGDQCRLVSAEQEWQSRSIRDLGDFWPKEEMPHSYMTHHANFALPRQGYSHWWKMFNSRQLLVLASLLKSIGMDCVDNGVIPVRLKADTRPFACAD